jgi:hypothetical protein
MVREWFIALIQAAQQGAEAADEKAALAHSARGVVKRIGHYQTAFFQRQFD